MAKSKELMVGIQHLRANWFSFRLLYLKALIRIFRLICKLRNEFLYQLGRCQVK